ncbi:unnamed protein product, partial [Adineta steineri]
MKIGSYSVDIQDVFDLIELESKVEHNLIKCDVDPKDLINNKLPIDALNTFTFNSQICENTFRIARSLSGTFSSNTNFSVKSFLKRCEKISIINSIKNRGGQIGDYQFYFPQHHKNHKDTINYSIGHVNELNLTENDIEIIIKNAFEAAQKYVAMIIDYTVDNNSSDEDSDEENCSDENDVSNVLNNEEQLSPNNTDDEEEGNTLATDVPDTAQKKFNGC